MITLYAHPFSQHSRRVVALLEETALPYENVTVALENGEHMAPAFLAINPNHQVPSLIDGDVRIHESNAILRYLCNKHGLTDWYPGDPDKRAVVDQWLDWNQARLALPVFQIVFNTAFAGDDADQDAIAAGRRVLPELAGILESTLAERDFLAGDAATIADFSVASNITQLGLVGAQPDGAATAAWYGRVCRIPGYRSALPPPPA